VREALTEMLKLDEVGIKDGKWRFALSEQEYR
jgi:hypothetical protein